MPANREKPKTESVRMRISTEVKEEIIARAAERNLSMTDFLIRAGLGRATRDRADVDAINELRGCAEKLKEIYHVLKRIADGEQLIPPEIMDQQMVAITSCIDRVWRNGSNAE